MEIIDEEEREENVREIHTIYMNGSVCQSGIQCR